jgi:hypothetical protein
VGDGSPFLLLATRSVILGVAAILAVFVMAVAFDRSVLRRERIAPGGDDHRGRATTSPDGADHDGAP